MATLDRIPAATTGIGSLPHHNIDAALEYSFAFEIPFLPQIPIRNPWEYSIPQALESLPGIRIESDGSALIDTGVWVGLARSFDERLSHAFDRAAESTAFESFEPSAATSSSWQPFLWELQERATKTAKLQIVGPLTAQWSLRSTDGARLDHNADISRQIFRLVLARALGMVRRLKSFGVQPLLYLDEPALFVFSPENPAHLLGVQELKLLVQTLQKESVAVGLHCCSNTRWETILGLGLDILSFDTRLSLESLLGAKESLRRFLKSDGRLSLGAVTTSEPGTLDSDSKAIGAHLRARFDAELADLAPSALKSALWTPACGLALHTPKDAQSILSLLQDVRRSALA